MQNVRSAKLQSVDASVSTEVKRLVYYSEFPDNRSFREKLRFLIGSTMYPHEYDISAHAAFNGTNKGYRILYHRIQIATPRHNGKVERQHRTDELRFYKHIRMYSLEDGRKQLQKYQRESNDHIMTCLNMKSPNQVLAGYLNVF